MNAMKIESTTMEWTAKDYGAGNANDWCPGCGDFGILNSLQRALAEMNLPPHRVAVFGGIGCSGKTPYYLPVYGIHTLHGRVLPYATGAKLSNPNLTVVAVGGDGDGMAIGAGHFVNSGRRNVDLTYILFNNEVYGLTKGQASPTLPLGLQPKSLPEPNRQVAVNALTLAMTAGFTWIGRGYAFNVKQLVGLIQKAIEHKGLAYLEVLQPCPTYNNLHTQEWFSGKDLDSGRPRVYDVQEEDYDPVISHEADAEILHNKMMQLLEKAHEWGDRIPTGVLLENRNMSTFTERFTDGDATQGAEVPAERTIADAEGRSNADLALFFDELAV